DCRQRDSWVHRSATGRTGKAIAKFKWVVAGCQECAMTDFRVPGFVPGNSGQIVFGLEILEPNVPDECAEGLDGVHFIALRAHETEAEVFIRILGEARLAVGSVVVAGVLECLETNIAQGN